MSDLRLGDLVYLKGENKKILGRVSSKNIGSNGYHGCVHYSQYDLKNSPNFSNGFQTFFETQILRNFGQVSNKELEEKYPEFMI